MPLPLSPMSTSPKPSPPSLPVRRTDSIQPIHNHFFVSIAVVVLLLLLPLRPIGQYLILAICTEKPLRVVPLPKQNLYVNFNWWIMGWTDETFHASRERKQKQKRKKNNLDFLFSVSQQIRVFWPEFFPFARLPSFVFFLLNIQCASRFGRWVYVSNK